MHSLFERRRPGHASLFDRGLVSPFRCRKQPEDGNIFLYMCISCIDAKFTDVLPQKSSRILTKDIQNLLLQRRIWNPTYAEGHNMFRR